MRKRFDTARDAVATILLTAAIITTPMAIFAHAPAADDKEAKTETVSTVIETKLPDPEEATTAADLAFEPKSAETEPETTAESSSDIETAETPAETEPYIAETTPSVPDEAYSEEYAEPEPEPIIYDEPADEGSLYPPDEVSYENPWYFGSCRCTAYCSCPMCCDNFTTHTGTTVTEGRTVAVDPAYIPFGSHLIINGQEYIAEDSGGAIKGRCIDIYFDTHEECVNFGLQYLDVYVVSIGDGSVNW